MSSANEECILLKVLIQTTTCDNSLGNCLVLRKGYVMKRCYNKKWLIVLLILTIAIPHGFIGASTHKAYAAWTGKVIADTLNVRTKPSTTADKVELNGTFVYLIKGETVNIIEKQGDFYYVSLRFNGKLVEGFVHKDFISVEVTPTPKPTATPKPTTAPKATPKPNSGDAVEITKSVSLKATVTAKSLNVRSGPGTSYKKAGGLLKGDVITVISEKVVDGEEWYGISFKSEGKTRTGYVLNTFIKLNMNKSIKGEIAASKLKIRAKANSQSAYLKDKKGNILYLKKGKNVTILEETSVAGVKWFKVSFTVSEKQYTGYADAAQVSFIATEVKATPTPKPTVTSKPTATPKATATPKPTKKPNAEPTKKPTPTPKPSTSGTPIPTAPVTPTPTLTPTPVPTQAPGGTMIQVPDNPVNYGIGNPVNGFVVNTAYLNIYQNIMASPDYIYYNNQPVTLINGQKVLVTGVVNVDRLPYYSISTSDGIYGYVRAEFIYIGDTLPNGSSVTVTVTPTPGVDTSNLDFESKLSMEGFPESYKSGLRALHAQYPNWEFKAYQTGLDWNTVISAESVPGKNVIPNSKGVEWKSLENGAYNWKTDTFIVFDGSTWVTASKEAIAYYMDPRNFLNSSGIFQFELLKYQSTYQNVSGVENILKGTAMYNAAYTYTDDSGSLLSLTYSQTFIKAAEYSGVSPYHLASRVKQEVVTGPTTLSNSVSGTYSGYEGLYNFYNIGANDSAGGGAIANGLNFARKGSTNAVSNSMYMIPWTSPYKSIVGGSYYIGGSYINRGQDTVYLQKFNVTPISTYYHQYMTNVEAPYAEGKKILTAYNGMADSPIIFSIPVYQNMPEMVSAAPITKFNPNNRMKSLQILDNTGAELKITPTFNQTEYNYYLIVANTVDYIQVNATTVSKKATISGGGGIPLNVGNNTVIISVIAENGDIANYTINIVRQ